MIYILDTDLQVLSLLVNAGPDACPYFDDTMRETIADGALTYEFTTLGNHEASSYLSSTGYIMRANLRGELLLFKIRSILEKKQPDGRIFKTVYCENAALELIHDIVRPTVLYSASPETALTSVLQGTEWQRGTVEWLGLFNFEFTGYPTVLAAVQEINATTGGEIVFRVEMDQGRVTGKFIDLLQQRGQQGTFRFDYRHDLQEVERTEDSSFLVTALIGVGKTDSGSNPVTMTGVEFTGTLPDGTKVYKSPNQDYVENPQALQRYGTRGRHKFGVYKTEEVDRLALIKRTWAELMTYSEPQLQYAVKVAVLSRLSGSDFSHKTYELGDSGDVIDHTFTPSLMVSARIIEREISFTDPSRDAVTLGNFVRYQPTAIEIIERLQDTIRQNASSWESGGEIIYKSPTPPDFPKDLDLWLDTSQEPHILKKYDAATGAWINASPTEPGDIGAISPGEAEIIAGDKAAEAEKNATDAAKNLVETSEAATRDFIQQNYKAAIIQQSTAPASPALNDLWIDTSTRPHVWKRWDGETWVNASVTSLEELAGQLKTAQIERGAVTEDLLAAAAISEAKLKDSAVSTYKIALNAIIANRIADRAVLTEKLANNAVTSLKLADGAVSAAKILDAAITDAKIAAGAVTELKLGNGAVTTDKMADLAVQAGKLANSAVTAEKIANLAVGTAAIQDAAITNAKIAAIDAGKITTGVLNAGRVQVGAGTTFAAGYDPTKIEVGGRNLAQRTNEMAWNSYYTSNVTFLTDAQGRQSVRVGYISGTVWGVQQIGAGQTMKLEKGKQYTISYEVRGTPGLPMNYTFIMSNGGTNEVVPVTGQPLTEENFTRYTGTFTKQYDATNSYVMISNRGNGAAGAYFEIRNVKVEAGNKATDWQPSPEDTAAKTTSEINTAVQPANDRIALWAYEDTVYIDGGSIYANSITANQIAAGAIGADQIAANAITAEHIAAGAITADIFAAGSITGEQIAADAITSGHILAGSITGDKIAANAITSEKIAAGAVTADQIAAGSITTTMIATQGLDAGVIKFGTMSGSRILANTMDANVLKSGTVIANNIYFGGILNGATGTFSGAVSVGSETGSNGYIVLQSGYLENKKTVNNISNRARLDSGRLQFWYVDNSNSSYNLSYTSSISQTPNGLEVAGAFHANGSTFGESSLRMAPYGPLIIDTSTASQGTILQNSRQFYQYGMSYFYDSVTFSGGNSGISFNTSFVNLTPSSTVTINPTGYFYISGGSSRYLSVDRYSTFSQFVSFNSTVQHSGSTTFYSDANFRSTTTLGGTTYFGGTKIIDSGEFISSISERGYCGVGGAAGGSANIAGVGVNFRVKKNYTPSYISLSATTSTATAYTTDHSNEGFYLYIVKPSGTTNNLYYYWRGYYSA